MSFAAVVIGTLRVKIPTGAVFNSLAFCLVTVSILILNESRIHSIVQTPAGSVFNSLSSAAE